jgi:hypothetical protein
LDVPALRGIVKGGKIVVDSDSLPAGGHVEIYIDDEDFELTAEQHAFLDLSIAQADRGETLPADEVLARVDRIARGVR